MRVHSVYATYITQHGWAYRTHANLCPFPNKYIHDWLTHQREREQSKCGTAGRTWRSQTSQSEWSTCTHANEQMHSIHNPTYVWICIFQQTISLVKVGFMVPVNVISHKYTVNKQPHVRTYVRMWIYVVCDGWGWHGSACPLWASSLHSRLMRTCTHLLWGFHARVDCNRRLFCCCYCACFLYACGYELDTTTTPSTCFSFARLNSWIHHKRGKLHINQCNRCRHAGFFCVWQHITLLNTNIKQLSFRNEKFIVL